MATPDDDANTNTNTGTPRASGGCDCGAVRYEVTGPLRSVIVCHCGQCQRTHGAPAPYSGTKKRHLHLVKDDGLRWYQSSTFARRGFCGACGASLFWEAFDEEYISVAAGTIDVPSGLKTIGHIFMGDRGDWYDVDDGLPTYPQSSNGELDGDNS